jgi:hypothetical protein
MRLKWSKTDLPGSPKNDFTGRDPDALRAYCRVRYTDSVNKPERWHWSASDGMVQCGSGDAITAKEAAEKAEAAYFAGRDRA